MQQVSSVLTTIKKNLPASTTNQTVFSQEERDLTQYFFAKIRMVYGVGKFEKTWPTEIDLKAAKIEWCKRISINNRQQIDAMFEFIKTTIKPDDWPTINYILTCNKSLAPNHSPYVKIEYRPDYKEKGLIQIQKIKNLFNMQKQS